MRRTLIGIIILGIGIGGTYTSIKHFYIYVNAISRTLDVISPPLPPPQYPQYVYQGEGLPPDIIEEEKVKAKPRTGETRRAQVSAERRTTARKPAPTSNVNKKIEPKKETKPEEEKPSVLQELTPAAAPITEKEQSPLSAKLIAYMDVEKILSWLANIITIITGILIILRKRDDPL